MRRPSAPMEPFISRVPDSWKHTTRTHRSNGCSKRTARSSRGRRLLAQTTGAKFRGGSPAIGADGTIYAVAGSQVLAFLPDGSPLWSYSTGGTLQSALAIGGDGTLYVPSTDHRLYAFAP